jgi:hypothetical protein
MDNDPAVWQLVEKLIVDAVKQKNDRPGAVLTHT